MDAKRAHSAERDDKPSGLVHFLLGFIAMRFLGLEGWWQALAIAPLILSLGFDTRKLKI